MCSRVLCRVRGAGQILCTKYRHLVFSALFDGDAAFTLVYVLVIFVQYQSVGVSGAPV